MMSRHFNLLRCLADHHTWREVGLGMEYGGFSRDKRECTVCGRGEDLNGYKLYEPPYWATDIRVIREGNLSKLKELGLK